MRQPMRSAVFAIFLIGTTTALFGAGCGTSSQGPMDTGALAADTSEPILVCGGNSDGRATEWYVPSAMRDKLAAYPDFASTVAVQSVTTCSEARSVMAAYNAYSSHHPGFDRDQPAGGIITIGDEAAVAASPYEPPQMRANIPKILGGTTSTNSPVVGLDSAQPAADAGGFDLSFPICTGTFITKNFVLTAAHCATIYHLKGRPPNGQSFWDFSFADFAATDGRLRVPDVSDGKVIQYIPKSYLGWKLGSNNAVANSPYDLMLLYFPYQDNGNLPVQSDGSPATMGVALSVFSSECGSGGKVWGWGKPDTTAERSLSTSDLCSGTLDLTLGGQLGAQFPAAASNFVCQGDSGGPWVEQVSTNRPGATTVPAILAVLSGVAPPYQKVIGGAICAAPGSPVFFTPVASSFNSFIEPTLQKWYPAPYKCDRFLDPSTAVLNYANCQLDPCSTDDDCCAPSSLSPGGKGSRDCSGKKRWYCAKPGSQLNGNCNPSVCNAPPDQDPCSCIKGMCMPRNRPSSQ